MTVLDVTFTTVLYEPDWSRTGAIVRDVLGSLEACELTAALKLSAYPCVSTNTDEDMSRQRP